MFPGKQLEIETLRAEASPALLGSFHALYAIGRDNGHFANWLLALPHEQRVWALAYMAAIRGALMAERQHQRNLERKLYRIPEGVTYERTKP